MYHIFFIHSSVDGHLGCFLCVMFLALVCRDYSNIGAIVWAWDHKMKIWVTKEV